MLSRIARTVDSVSAWSGATVFALLAVVVWAFWGYTQHWSNLWILVGGSVSGIPPFIVCFAIQNSARRDTRAVQLKLDALLLAIENAPNHLVGLERKPDAVAEAIREEICAPVDEPEAVPATVEPHEATIVVKAPLKPRRRPAARKG